MTQVEVPNVIQLTNSLTTLERSFNGRLIFQSDFVDNNEYVYNILYIRLFAGSTDR